MTPSKFDTRIGRPLAEDNPTLVAALELSQRFRMPIVFLTAKSKKRAFRRGNPRNASTREAATIRRTLRDCPGLGIGILLGAVTRLWSLDFDQPDARASFEAKFQPLPLTPTVRTARTR